MYMALFFSGRNHTDGHTQARLNTICILSLHGFEKEHSPGGQITHQNAAICLPHLRYQEHREIVKFMFWNKTRYHRPPHPLVWLMVKSSFYCSASRRRLWLSGIQCSPLKQRDQNPADKSSKHRVPLRAWVMADASAHMTAASSADADEAEMPNMTFSECHITSGLDVTRWHYAGAWKGCSSGGDMVTNVPTVTNLRMWYNSDWREEDWTALNGRRSTSKHPGGGCGACFASAGSVFFFPVFIGDKVLRQLTPTGIIIPIIKQFFKHIRNPSIKS